MPRYFPRYLAVRVTGPSALGHLVCVILGAILMWCLCGADNRPPQAIDGSPFEQRSSGADVIMCGGRERYTVFSFIWGLQGEAALKYNLIWSALATIRTYTAFFEMWKIRFALQAPILHFRPMNPATPPSWT